MKLIYVLVTLLISVILSTNVYSQSASKTLTIGPKTNDNKNLKFNRNSSTPPSIRWNESASKLQFSNDGSVFSDLGSGGGGGDGGLNALAENNPGFESGITIGWTCTSTTCTSVTSGDNLLWQTTTLAFDATTAADTLSSVPITIQPGLWGAACQGKFLYKGGDSNLLIQVVNADGETLASSVIAPTNIPSELSVFFVCPTADQIGSDPDKGILRLLITAQANANVIYVDQAYLGSLQNLGEATLPDVFSAKVSATGVVSDESSNWINGNCSLGGTNTADFTCTFVSGIFSAAPNCALTVGQAANNTSNQAIGFVSHTSSSSFTARTNQNITTVARAFEVICQKSTDSKQTVQVYKNIPKIAENINVFSAKISSSDVVSDENVDWINGNCTAAGAGSQTCVFNAGIFTVAPTCVANTNQASNGSTRVQSLSSTGVEVISTNFSGTGQDVNTTLICIKSGVDFKLPVVQPIVIGQVQQPDANPMKIAAATSAATCAASPCTISNAKGVASVTRGGTGAYTVTFDSGYFTTTPYCTVSSTTFTFNKVSSTSASYLFNCGNSAGSVQDCAFDVFCAGY